MYQMKLASFSCDGAIITDTTWQVLASTFVCGFGALVELMRCLQHFLSQHLGLQK